MIFNIEILTSQCSAQQISRPKNAHNMIETVPTNHDTRVGRLRKTRSHNTLRIIQVEHVNIVTMRHDRADTLFIKA